MFAPDGTPRVRVRVRAAIAKGRRAGDVFLPDRLLPKLTKLWAYKRKRGETVAPGDALYCNQSRRRISKHRLQFAWRMWQIKAGFDRHVSPLTTIIYAHPSDQEMASRVRGLPC